MTAPATPPAAGEPQPAGSSPPPMQSCDWCLMAFLSSSLGELAKEREKLDEVLRTTDLPLRVWRYEEDAGAASISHQDVWRDTIVRSDLYVGVFANKLGKYTLDEYEHAREHGKPMLLFAKALPDEERLPELQEFLARADDPESGFAFGLFESPDDFAVKVQLALRNEFARRFRQSAKIGDRPKVTSEAGIAVAPTQQGWEASRVAPGALPQTTDVPVTRSRQAAPPPQEPVGQKAALARLKDLACRGQPLLDVLGEPGSGKTGLLRRLADATSSMACPDGGELEFPDGKGITPQVAAGDGFADVVQAVWEQFHKHGDEAGGPATEQALADLAGKQALLLFPDSPVAPEILRELAARLPGALLVAEPREGANEPAVFLDPPGTEDDWRAILKNELALVSEPLPSEVAGFLKDLDGRPALIAQLANRFKDFLANTQGGSLAELAQRQLGEHAKSWLIPARYRRLARMAAAVEVPAPREVFVAWLEDELGSRQAAEDQVDGAVESGILVPGSPRLTLAPGLRPIVSEEPVLDTLDHRLAALGLEGESVAQKLEGLAGRLGEVGPEVLDRVGTEVESAVDKLLGVDLPMLDTLQSVVGAIRSGEGVGGALKAAAGTLLSAAHDDTGLRKMILDSAVGWAKEARLDDLFFDRGFAHEMIEWAKGFGRWDDVIAIGKPLEAALALTGRSDAWARTISSVMGAARETGDLSTEAWALHQRGTKALYDADHDAARRDLRDALRLRRRLGEREGAALTRRNLGLVPTAMRTPKRVLAWLGAAVMAMTLVLGTCAAQAEPIVDPPADLPPVPPDTIEVTKTVDANGDGDFGDPVLDAVAAAGPARDVVFQVQVHPPGEPVEIVALADVGPADAVTDLTRSDCAGAAGTRLSPGDPPFTCTFVAPVECETGGTHANEVTVTARGSVIGEYAGGGRVAIGCAEPPVVPPAPPFDLDVDVAGVVAPGQVPEGAARVRPVDVLALFDARAWPVTVVAVDDDRLGGVEDVPGATCSVPQVVDRGETFGCRYPLQVAEGNAGSTQAGVLTVTAIDADGRLGVGQDRVPVTFLDVQPRLSATLAGSGAVVAGGTADLVLAVRNTSEVTDPVTIEEWRHGDGSTIAACPAPVRVEPGAVVECAFRVDVPAEPGAEFRVEAAVTGRDDERNAAAAEASTVLPVEQSGIVVAVDATPGTDVAFPFEAPISGTASAGSPRAVGLAPGAYTLVAGDPPAGWRLTGVRCDDGLPDRAAGPVAVIVPAGATVTCTFAYAGEPSADLTAKIDISPEVLLWPDPDDPAAPAERSVTVTNTGSGPFDVTLGTAGAPFVLDPGSCAASAPLAGGDSCSFSITFAPTGSAAAVADVTVTASTEGTRGDRVVLLQGRP